MPSAFGVAAMASEGSTLSNQEEGHQYFGPARNKAKLRGEREAEEHSSVRPERDPTGLGRSHDRHGFENNLKSSLFLQHGSALVLLLFVIR